MKVEEFTTGDGKTGQKYKLEVGDELEIMFDSVGKKERPAVVKGKAVIITDHFLGVKKGDTEVTLSLTGGQARAINTQSKGDSIKGKTLIGAEYENDYGKQIGARLQ